MVRKAVRWFPSSRPESLRSYVNLPNLAGCCWRRSARLSDPSSHRKSMAPLTVTCLQGRDNGGRLPGLVFDCSESHYRGGSVRRALLTEEAFL